MGILSSIFGLFTEADPEASHREVRILMLGLDGAGKTTILYRMSIGEVVKTTPTLGFNVESVNYKKTHFTVWDIGGQEKLRQIWKHYYKDTQGVIFVLDSDDRQRLAEAQQEIHRIMNDNSLANVPLLVLANKQDIPTAMNYPEIKEGLKIEELEGNHNCHVQLAIAVTGDGLYEGIAWLSKNIR